MATVNYSLRIDENDKRAADVVVVCAKKVTVDAVITNDAEFQRIDRALMRVISPDEFLNM